MIEPEVTPEEELEAAALRAALEEGRAGEHLPDDALEAASLLRFGSSEGELSDAQSARLRSELLTSLPARAGRATRPRIMIWLAALSGVGALTALLLTMRQPPAETQASLAAPAAPVRHADLEAAEESQLARANPSDDRPDTDADEQAELERKFARPPADTFAEQAVVSRNDAPAAEQARGMVSARAKRASESAGRATSVLGLDRVGSGGASAPVATLAPPASAAKPAAPAAAPSSTRAELERARTRARRELDARIAARTAPAEAKGRARGAGREALLAELAATQAASLEDAERRPLQQDLYWRLADLALRQGRPAQALDWARQGIALDGSPSPFLGLLWQAQGEAHEALGEREAAARSYLEAQAISAALLREDLGQ